MGLKLCSFAGDNFAPFLYLLGRMGGLTKPGDVLAITAGTNDHMAPAGQKPKMVPNKAQDSPSLPAPRPAIKTQPVLQAHNAEAEFNLIWKTL